MWLAASTIDNYQYGYVVASMASAGYGAPRTNRAAVLPYILLTDQ